MEITLKCFHCGTEKIVEVSEPPVFAVQLTYIANESGMLGVIDNYFGRSLVFCNEECLKAETTKSGHVRMRPIGVKK